MIEMFSTSFVTFSTSNFIAHVTVVLIVLHLIISPIRMFSTRIPFIHFRSYHWYWTIAGATIERYNRMVPRQLNSFMC